MFPLNVRNFRFFSKHTSLIDEIPLGACLIRLIPLIANRSPLDWKFAPGILTDYSGFGVQQL